MLRSMLLKKNIIFQPDSRNIEVNDRLLEEILIPITSYKIPEKRVPFKTTRQIN